MKTSYKVKFWEIRPNKAGPRSSKAGKVISYTARWVVGGREKSQTFQRSTQAKNFLSDLRQAAKNGEEFDVDSGLPLSMLPSNAADKPARTWLEFSRAYVDMKWQGAAPKVVTGLRRRSRRFRLRWCGRARRSRRTWKFFGGRCGPTTWLLRTGRSPTRRDL